MAKQRFISYTHPDACSLTDAANFSGASSQTCQHACEETERSSSPATRLEEMCERANKMYG